MQMTPVPFWLMIVSIATAVLPVPRSPMISSRWPRPIGIMPSIALMPVCSGSVDRLAVDDAGRLELERQRASRRRSAARRRSALPSGSTTRPISPSPTGTLMTLPVRLAVSPSASSCQSPNSTHGDVVLLEVQREARDAVRELDHLERDAALEPVDAGDAVRELDDGADLFDAGRNLVLLDLLAQDRGDLVRLEPQLSPPVEPRRALRSDRRRASRRPRTDRSTMRSRTRTITPPRIDGVDASARA